MQVRLRQTAALAALLIASGAAFAQTPPADAPAAPPAAAAPAPAVEAPPAAPAPTPPPAAAAAPATAQRLTGAAAGAALAGNTLSGKVDGADKTIFFSNDGRLTMLEDSEQTQGKWEIRGREICVIVDDEDDDCYELEVTGDTAVLKEDDTTSYRLTITKGNAKNLPLGKR